MSMILSPTSSKTTNQGVAAPLQPMRFAHVTNPQHSSTVSDRTVNYLFAGAWLAGECSGDKPLTRWEKRWLQDQLAKRVQPRESSGEKIALPQHEGKVLEGSRHVVISPINSCRCSSCFYLPCLCGCWLDLYGFCCRQVTIRTTFLCARQMNIQAIAFYHYFPPHNLFTIHSIHNRLRAPLLESSVSFLSSKIEQVTSW